MLTEEQQLEIEHLFAILSNLLRILKNLEAVTGINTPEDME